jgi:hypothetical protein
MKRQLHIQQLTGDDTTVYDPTLEQIEAALLQVTQRQCLSISLELAGKGELICSRQHPFSPNRIPMLELLHLPANRLLKALHLLIRAINDFAIGAETGEWTSYDEAKASFAHFYQTEQFKKITIKI